MPKILVADDSIAVRKVAERLLTEQEAAGVCRQSVSDWGVDGKRVLVLIQDHTRPPALTVIHKEKP